MQRDTINRLLFALFLCYVLFLLGSQIGHLYWMLVIHTELRSAYDLDPQTAQHSWGFAGAGMLIMLMVGAPFCVVSLIRRFGDVDCNWTGGRHWIMFFWPISLSLYIGQVIHFIVGTVHLYLDLRWEQEVALCRCHDEIDPLLNYSLAEPLAHCQCLAPRDDCAYQITASDMYSITDEDLRRRGSDYYGNVTVDWMDSLDDVNRWMDGQEMNNNFQYMLVLAKSSALVTVLHFPLWLLDHYLVQMASDIKGDDTVTEDSESGTTRVKISVIVSELTAHTVYCFSENIDGFSLLDEYLEISDYFVNNGYFRDAILSFVGANIVLIAGFNGASHLLKGYPLVCLITKCLIVILNNLPFMVIRIYMLFSVGGSRILDAGLSTNFFFFVSKEAIFVIVYFMEVGFSVYQYRIDKKWTPGSTDNSSGSRSSVIEHSEDDRYAKEPQDRMDRYHVQRHHSSDDYDHNEDRVSKKSRMKRPKVIGRQESLLSDDIEYNNPVTEPDDTYTTQPYNPTTKRKGRRKLDQSHESHHNEGHNNEYETDFSNMQENNVTYTEPTPNQIRLTGRKKKRQRPKEDEDDVRVTPKTTEVRYKAPVQTSADDITHDMFSNNFV